MMLKIGEHLDHEIGGNFWYSIPSSEMQGIEIKIWQCSAHSKPCELESSSVHIMYTDAR